MTANTQRLADGSHRSGVKALVRFLPAAARILMGLLFFVTGLNGFLNFLPQPRRPCPRVPWLFPER